MPTPLYIGNCNWREVHVERSQNKRDADSMEVRLRGRTDQINTELANWPPGRTYPGYPNMFLESARAVDASPMSEIHLSFRGFLSAFVSDGGLIDKTSDVSLQSVELVSSGGDTVNVSYYGSTTAYRYMVRGNEPTVPRYSAVVPTSLPLDLLFNFSPPKFKGTIGGRYRVAARLTQFPVTEIAKRVWSAVETYTVMIEPTT